MRSIFNRPIKFRHHPASIERDMGKFQEYFVCLFLPFEKAVTHGDCETGKQARRAANKSHTPIWNKRVFFLVTNFCVSFSLVTSRFLVASACPSKGGRGQLRRSPFPSLMRLWAQRINEQKPHKSVAMSVPGTVPGTRYKSECRTHLPLGRTNSPLNQRQSPLLLSCCAQKNSHPSHCYVRRHSGLAMPPQWPCFRTPTPDAAGHVNITGTSMGLSICRMRVET